jgi:hypothetical protein
MLRAKMNFRPIVTILSIKYMNARGIYIDMNDILGEDCIGGSTVTKYLREKVSRSRSGNVYEVVIGEFFFVDQLLPQKLIVLSDPESDR